MFPYVIYKKLTRQQSETVCKLRLSLILSPLLVVVNTSLQRVQSVTVEFSSRQCICHTVQSTLLVLVLYNTTGLAASDLQKQSTGGALGLGVTKPTIILGFVVPTILEVNTPGLISARSFQLIGRFRVANLKVKWSSNTYSKDLLGSSLLGVPVGVGDVICMTHQRKRGGSMHWQGGGRNAQWYRAYVSDSSQTGSSTRMVINFYLGTLCYRRIS